MTEVRINTETESTVSDPREEFIKLFTRYQRRVFLFILSQVPSPVDAEEIHQETNVVVWNKFDQFELGTNFFAWACRIASYEVLKYREKRRRDRHLRRGRDLQARRVLALSNVAQGRRQVRTQKPSNAQQDHCC